MATTAPNLGYGQKSEASIDQVNIWMRSTPWYQEQMRQWGQDPGHPNLSKSQSEQILKMAQANGVVVDEGNMEVDDHGNFNPQGHKLRNTLIVAGLAAATIATMGAAGAFSGAAAGAGAGAAGGVEAGATAGLGAAASSGAALGGLSTLPALAGTAAGVGGAGAAATGAGAFDAAGNFIGPSTVSSIGGGGGTLGNIAGFLSTPGGSQLASTAGGVFANIYGANKQADASKYGVDAQTAAAKYAADLQDAAAQRTEAFTRQQAESGWQSNEHTQKSNYDQWAARQNAIMGSLGSQLGINYTPPAYAPGIDPNFTDTGAAGAISVGSGQTPAAAAASGGPSAQTQFLKGLLDSGADPQAAIAQTNQKFGLGEGNSAKYYDPSQHGGVATIGLPDSYLALTNGKWDVTQRQGGSTTTPAASTKGTLASFVNPTFMPLSTGAPPPTPYQPGTLGAYFGRA